MDDIAWVSSTRAAEVLGLTPRTLYRLIDEGALVAYRFGRVIRVKETDVVAYLERARIASGTLGNLAQWDQDGGRGAQPVDADFLLLYDLASQGPQGPTENGVHDVE